MSDESPSSPVIRLLIEMDLDILHFTHFQLPGSLILTLQDFPQVLQNKLWPFLEKLQDGHFQKIDFDSHRSTLIFVDKIPTEPRLLDESENILELFGLVDWWIRKDHQKHICDKDVLDRRQHATWTCECGEAVAVPKESYSKEACPLCSKESCPSWTKFTLCTGKSAKRLRVA